MRAAKPPTALVALPGLLTTLVCALAIYVWGSSLDWQFGNLSIYLFFPVLGLLAYSIMWSHYMAGFMQKTFLQTANLDNYFRWTSYAVLVLIVLHPGLLAYQRFRDGFGLPPRSETSYVAMGMSWIVVLGMVSLLIFLVYELHRWFKDRSWWKYVLYAGDAAMLAIFYHGLELGTQTHIGWFRIVWWFYGITLVLVLAYTYTVRFRKVRRAAGNA